MCSAKHLKENGSVKERSRIAKRQESRSSRSSSSSSFIRTECSTFSKESQIKTHDLVKMIREDFHNNFILRLVLYTRNFAWTKGDFIFVFISYLKFIFCLVASVCVLDLLQMTVRYSMTAMLAENPVQRLPYSWFLFCLVFFLCPCLILIFPSALISFPFHFV